MYGFKQLLNYFMILFVFTFVINCAEESKDNKDDATNNSAIVNTAEATGVSIIDSDPSARKKDESPEDYQLRLAGKNNVKKRTTTNYLYDLNHNLMDKGGVAEEVEFDEKGRRIVNVVYRGLNKINNTWYFKYDQKGNLIEFESYDRDDILQLKKNMTYNSNNLLIESKEVYTSKGNDILYKYTYNDQGLLVKTIGSNSKGGESIESREYNNAGDIEKIIVADQNGNITAESKMEYDANKNLVKEIIKYVNQQEQFTTYSNYSGPFAGEIVTPLQKKVFEFNQKGNVTLDIMFNSAGGRQHKYINEYDENGLILKKTRYDGKDRPALVIKYEYEFYK